MEEQKGINVQLAQRIDTVESTLNKRIDGLESSCNTPNIFLNDRNLYRYKLRKIIIT